MFFDQICPHFMISCWRSFFKCGYCRDQDLPNTSRAMLVMYLLIWWVISSNLGLVPLRMCAACVDVSFCLAPLRKVRDFLCSRYHSFTHHLTRKAQRWFALFYAAVFVVRQDHVHMLWYIVQADASSLQSSSFCSSLFLIDNSVSGSWWWLPTGEKHLFHPATSFKSSRKII